MRRRPWSRQRGVAAVLVTVLLVAARPGGAQHLASEGWASAGADLSPGRTSPVAAVLMSPGAAHLAEQDRPPLRTETVALQLAGGVAGGAVGSLVMAGALLPFFRDAEWAPLASVAGGVLLGYPVGAAAGVYLVGNRGPQRGSFFATLVGAVAGAAAAIPLVNATDAVSYLVFVPVGATAGFAVSRRHPARTGPRPEQALH